MSDYDQLPQMLSTTPFQVSKFRKLCVSTLVLDIGCGYGRNMDALTKESGLICLGIDTSVVQLTRAAPFHLGRIALSSALKIPFLDKAFGGALAMGVIDSIITDSGLEQFFAETARVLKPLGPLWLNFYTTNPRFAVQYGAINPDAPGIVVTKSGLTVRHWTKDEVINAADKWFEIISFRFLQFQSMNQRQRLPGLQVRTRRRVSRNEEG